jgi:hypothetical protein
MKGKVARAGAALMFFVFAPTFRVDAQQSDSNPAARGSDERAAGSPSSSTATPALSRIVLKAGGRSVTQADIEFFIHNLDQQSQRALAQQGLRVLGEQYALMLVLAQEATSKHLNETAGFRRQMEAQQERMLAQAEFQDLQQQTKVSSEEISQYYATHGADFDVIQARQIVVRTKPQDAKEATPGMTVEEGRARVEAIKKALASGTDPAQVGKDFAIANQVWVEAEPRTFRQSASLLPLQKAAFKLKDGEFTETQQVGGTLTVLQVVGHRRLELKDTSQEIEDMVRNQKLNTEIKELKTKSNIWMDETYFKTPATPAPAATPARQGNPPAKP